MAIHQSGEDYLEAILTLRQKTGYVRSVDVAAELGYSKPSVSIAMKKLREQGYVRVNEAGLLFLTKEGEALACSVYERHKTLKKALMLLGVDEESAAEEACKLEHAISDSTLEKIKLYLQKVEG